MNPILISGGGISGLALAIALTRKGIPVRVYEKVPHLRGMGAGLILGPNAWKAIKVLGLSELLAPACRPLSSFKLLTHSGALLSEQPASLSRNLSGGSQSWSIHRADLHRLLIEALPEGSLCTGRASNAVRQHEDGVELTFTKGQQAEGSALISADGIHSVIRRQLQPDRVPRYAGYTCWRGVIQMKMADSIATETWGPAGRFGIVPLAEDKVYWFATKNAPRRDPEMSKWTSEDLYQNFSGYHSPIEEILQQTPDESILWNDIEDLSPASSLADGRVLLIGDAGHATTPNMGQGAAMALEDAAWLASNLDPGNIMLSFQQFELARLQRVNWVVNRSWQFGKMAQLENRLACGIRNTLMRHLPEGSTRKTLRTLYEVDF